MPTTYRAMFVEQQTNTNYMILPGELKEKLGGQKIDVNFGFKRVSVFVTYPAGKSSSASTISEPIVIFISSEIKRRIALPGGCVYRLKLTYGQMSIGPVIGLLLGSKYHMYSPKYMEKYSDRLGVYKKVGGLICAFSSSSVNWNSFTVNGLYYNFEKSKWEFGQFPLPKVIYRRNFHGNKIELEHLKALVGKGLFNSDRFDKWQMYEWLSVHESFRENLPDTKQLLNIEVLFEMLQKWGRVILKPVSLSRGRGIMIVEKLDSLFRLEDYRMKEIREVMLTGEELRDMCLSFLPNHDYIVQQHLNLALYQGHPYDIRVVMQKNRLKKWNCSGIECRCSGSGSLITNIARGGRALRLSEVCQPYGRDFFKATKQRIFNLCHNFVHRMEASGGSFAEFGIDLALDRKGSLWFIEANVFPSFKGFKALDYKNYIHIRYNPLEYAAALTGF